MAPVGAQGGIKNNQKAPMALKHINSLLLLLALVSSAQAQVYKCKDQNGKIVFSDIACDTRSDGGAINVRPNTIDTSGSREQILSKQVRDLQDQVAQSQQNQASGAAPSQQEDKASSSACKQAALSYENEAGSIRKDRDAIASKKSKMYIACGQKEPPQNTQTVRAALRNYPLTNCNPGGICYGVQGERYTPSGGNNYSGPQGLCQMASGLMYCP